MSKGWIISGVIFGVLAAYGNTLPKHTDKAEAALSKPTILHQATGNLPTKANLELLVSIVRDVMADRELDKVGQDPIARQNNQLTDYANCLNTAAEAGYKMLAIDVQEAVRFADVACQPYQEKASLTNKAYSVFGQREVAVKVFASEH